MRFFLFPLLIDVVTAAITSYSVAHQTQIAGASGQATVTFTIANTLAADGKITVTFPTGMDLATLTPSVASVSGITGTLTPTIAGQKVILLRGGGATPTSGSTTITIVLNNIKNPATATMSGTYSIGCYANNGSTQTADAPVTNVAAVTIYTGALTSASITPASYITGVSGEVTAAFTLATALPNNGKIVLTFPTGFVLSSAGYSSKSGMDGSISASVSGQIVTFTRSGGSQTNSGTAVTITGSNIQNPSAAGSYSGFGIETFENGGTPIDFHAVAGAVTIISPAPVGSACTQDIGCTSGACDTTTTNVCIAVGVGSTCASDSDCTSNKCTSATCAAVGYNENCTGVSDCTSGRCIANKCQPELCAEDYRVSSASCVTCNPGGTGTHRAARNLKSGPDTECEPNECTCTNGTAARGTACTSHKANLCSSCDTGFGLSSGSCYEQCNTEPAAGSRPPNTSGTYPGSLIGTDATTITCTSGYHGTIQLQCTAGSDTYTVSGTCAANVCNCTNGTPATGTSCTVHDTNICGSCNSNYSLVSGSCYPTCSTAPSSATHPADTQGSYPSSVTGIDETTVTCATGHVGTVRLECTTVAGTYSVSGSCTECAANYYMNTSNDCIACPAKRYRAAGDTEAGAEDCYVACPANHYVSGVVCTPCPAGSFIAAGSSPAGANNSCEAYVCSCSYGTAVTGVACTANNLHKCDTCDANYTKSGNYCYPTCPKAPTGGLPANTVGTYPASITAPDATTITCAVEYSGTITLECNSVGGIYAVKGTCNACATDHFVTEAGVCEACATGTNRAAGDPLTGGATTCYATCSSKPTSGLPTNTAGTYPDLLTGSDNTTITCAPGYRGTILLECLATGAYVVSGTCEANTCTCQNGVIATGAECTSHMTNMCASCDTHYTKVGSDCIPTCTKSPAASGAYYPSKPNTVGTYPATITAPDSSTITCGTGYTGTITLECTSACGTYDVNGDCNSCAANYRVQSSACVACGANTYRAAGDDSTGADTACSAVCPANYRASNGTCVPCDAGTIIAAGSDPAGPDTTCDACAADYHVSNDNCVACPSGTTRLAGDLKTGGDTTCSNTYTHWNVADNICFQAKDEGYASFTLLKEADEITLTHQSGFLTCCRFGCDSCLSDAWGSRNGQINVWISRWGKPLVMAPQTSGIDFYNLNAGTSLMSSVTATTLTFRTHFPPGTYQIWYGWDLTDDYREKRADGSTCVDISARAFADVPVYFYSSVRMRYQEAVDFCENKTGSWRIASVHSAAQEEKIRHVINDEPGTFHEAWVGASPRNRFGLSAALSSAASAAAAWEWHDNTPWDFTSTHFASSEQSRWDYGLVLKQTGTTTITWEWSKQAKTGTFGVVCQDHSGEDFALVYEEKRCVGYWEPKSWPWTTAAACAQLVRASKDCGDFFIHDTSGTSPTCSCLAKGEVCHENQTYCDTTRHVYRLSSSSRPGYLVSWAGYDRAFSQCVSPLEEERVKTGVMCCEGSGSSVLGHRPSCTTGVTFAAAAAQCAADGGKRLCTEVEVNRYVAWGGCEAESFDTQMVWTSTPCYGAESDTLECPQPFHTCRNCCDIDGDCACDQTCDYLGSKMDNNRGPFPCSFSKSHLLVSACPPNYNECGSCCDWRDECTCSGEQLCQLDGWRQDQNLQICELPLTSQHIGFHEACSENLNLFTPTAETFCDCSASPAFAAFNAAPNANGGGPLLWSSCSNNNCYSVRVDDRCVGKQSYSDLADGFLDTFCYDGWAFLLCPVRKQAHEFGTFCVHDEECASNRCVSSACAPRLCDANQYVSGAICTDCDATFRVGGDLRSGPDTVCTYASVTCPADMVSTASNTCELCPVGQHVDGTSATTCENNVCTCPNGSPAPAGDAACYAHEGHICASCATGYGLVGTTCEPTCITLPDPATRPSFTAGTYPLTVSGIDSTTITCAPGYTGTLTLECTTVDGIYTVSGTCTENVCKCENGIPATAGTAVCSTHGANICVSCFTGYWTQGTGCVPVCRKPSPAPSVSETTGTYPSVIIGDDSTSITCNSGKFGPIVLRCSSPGGTYAAVGKCKSYDTEHYDENTCRRNEYVSNLGRCTACAPGTYRVARDNTEDGPTSCYTTCPENAYATTFEGMRTCVACVGSTIVAGSNPDGPDTVCGPCVANYFVNNHACAPCRPGMERPAGDDWTGADTVCTDILCPANHYRRENQCEQCEPGMVRPAGDNATEDGETQCEELYCKENEFVSEMKCLPCGPGSTRPAGDKAKEGDTECKAPEGSASVELELTMMIPAGTDPKSIQKGAEAQMAKTMGVSKENVRSTIEIIDAAAQRRLMGHFFFSAGKPHQRFVFTNSTSRLLQEAAPPAGKEVKITYEIMNISEEKAQKVATFAQTEEFKTTLNEGMPEGFSVTGVKATPEAGGLGAGYIVLIVIAVLIVLIAAWWCVTRKVQQNGHEEEQRAKFGFGFFSNLGSKFGSRKKNVQEIENGEDQAVVTIPRGNSAEGSEARARSGADEDGGAESLRSA